MANYNKNDNQPFAGLIALILVIVLLFGVISWGSEGFVQWDVSKWFNSWGTEQEEDDTNENTQTGYQLSTFGSKDIQLTATKLTNKQKTQYGVSETALAAYKISAKANYEGISPKTVIWSVAWDDPEEAESAGDVTDYVTVNAYTNTMGNVMEVITILKNFNYTVDVQAGVEGKADVYATCQLDRISADYTFAPSYYEDVKMYKSYLADEVGGQCYRQVYFTDFDQVWNQDFYYVIPYIYTGPVLAYQQVTFTLCWSPSMSGAVYPALLDEFDEDEINDTYTITYTPGDENSQLQHDTFLFDVNGTYMPLSAFYFKIDFAKFLVDDSEENLTKLKNVLNDYFNSKNSNTGFYYNFYFTIDVNVVDRIGRKINLEDNTSEAMTAEELYAEETYISAEKGYKYDIYETTYYKSYVSNMWFSKTNQVK